MIFISTSLNWEKKIIKTNRNESKDTKNYTKIGLKILKKLLVHCENFGDVRWVLIEGIIDSCT